LITFLFSNHISLMSGVYEPELSMQEITTNKGQRTSVKLSDGTRVHLNAESKLIVPESYMNNNRIVTLEGEAYFEVEPHTNRTFFVHANHSVTQVLGTKFNVRAYPDEDNVEVVVAEGKVSLNSDENMLAPEVQLTRNQRGTFSRNGEVVASTITDAERYLDWTKGKLTFHDAPVGEVKSRLERWYDIEVILKDDFPVNERLLTGTFENVPLSVVLSSIALSLDLQYKQDGNTVILLKNSNQQKR
jgi:transmembrane sensor